MLGRFTVFLGFLLLAGAAATASQAASFDCGKAGTPFEKAICADDTLSEADSALAVAYATALGGLSETAAATMKADQKAWLDFAQSACAPEAKPLRKGKYDDDGIQCLISTFDSRITALAGSKMVGRQRVYVVSQYAALPDPDYGTEGYEDYYWKVGAKTLTSSRIDGDSALAQAFNAFAEEVTAKFADQFAEPGKGNSDFDGTSDEDMTATITAIHSGRVTMTVNDYFFGHGAAHGNYSITYNHFVIGENRALDASDIFKGKAWKKTLLTLVVDQLKAKLGDSLMLDNPGDIADVVADPTRWDFADEGLLVQFEPYEVASYADGAVTVTIPWEKLSDITAEGWDTIAANY